MKNYCYIYIILVAFSCNQKKQDIGDILLKKEKASIAIKHTPPVSIKKEFEKEIENWKAYQNIQEFTSKFKRTSPNEALSNALEFKRLVMDLKDSIKPTIFNVPSFNTRINVLINETERFADITFISAIKTEEVNQQVGKTLAAFSALNAKINTLLSQKSFEDAIEIAGTFIGLDSTKIDSVSKKSIKKLERLSKKEKIKKDKELPNFKNNLKKSVPKKATHKN
jgi:hypothetical protein